MTSNGSSSRIWIKRLLLGAVNAIGRSLGRAPRGRTAHILTYHQVRRTRAEILDPYNEVTLERLTAHVAALQAAGLRLVTVSDLWSRLQAGDDPRRLVALTFDDGLVEHDELVAPALQLLHGGGR